MILRRAHVAASVLCLVFASVANVRFVVEFFRNAAGAAGEKSACLSFPLLAHALLELFAALDFSAIAKK
jgi:prolipoprotein diacylglyceryltransferase